MNLVLHTARNVEYKMCVDANAQNVICAGKSRVLNLGKKRDTTRVRKAAN